ncbi:uncharacterized protein LOC112552613 [Pogonomyrmex barbatus]|uniref:Uncharacterized protein LOC112552613 n=1 Tax=Pogonomyrmex barbatus TaxID=144034 RepID=A0A8N1S7D0_9HYME|nr:uncharacterized protein LOC112552613 [Pogonomyrmex barbatus]
MTLIDADCSINLITKLLSIVLPMCVCLLKYGAFLYNNQKMKHLMDLIWYHWSIIQDKQEVAILKKYTKFSRRFTLFMLHIFSLSIFVIIMGHMLPMILDIIIPLNSSRPRHFYMIMEYFIDQERYFLWLLLHTSMTLLVAALMVLSIGTMLMSCVFHACAMFKIVFISLSTSNVNELFTTFTFVVAHFCYLYVGNHAGQIVTDHHVDVFNATCRSYWYTAPLRAQKLLLFIMQRTSKNFSFVFGGIFVVSLKGFSTLASMSISYFTVIYSMIYSR